MCEKRSSSGKTGWLRAEEFNIGLIRVKAVDLRWGCCDDPCRTQDLNNRTDRWRLPSDSLSSERESKPKVLYGENLDVPIPPIQDE
jgi:hypothetical protein